MAECCRVHVGVLGCGQEATSTAPRLLPGALLGVDGERILVEGEEDGEEKKLRAVVPGTPGSIE